MILVLSRISTQLVSEDGRSAEHHPFPAEQRVVLDGEIEVGSPIKFRNSSGTSGITSRVTRVENRFDNSIIAETRNSTYQVRGEEGLLWRR